jgi:hypothetical protein
MQDLGCKDDPCNVFLCGTLFAVASPPGPLSIVNGEGESGVIGIKKSYHTFLTGVIWPKKTNRLA